MDNVFTVLRRQLFGLSWVITLYMGTAGATVINAHGCTLEKGRRTDWFSHQKQKKQQEICWNHSETPKQRGYIILTIYPQIVCWDQHFLSCSTAAPETKTQAGPAGPVTAWHACCTRLPLRCKCWGYEGGPLRGPPHRQSPHRHKESSQRPEPNWNGRTDILCK